MTPRGGEVFAVMWVGAGNDVGGKMFATHEATQGGEFFRDVHVVLFLVCPNVGSFPEFGKRGRWGGGVFQVCEKVEVGTEWRNVVAICNDKCEIWNIVHL